MQRVFVEVLLLLQLFASLAKTETVYVTDLPLFTSLAPCVQTALSYQVMGLTDSACPEAVTALASCACSKDDIFKSLASAISTEVLQDCDPLDTEDVTSASIVMSVYCNQNNPAPIPTPAPSFVSQYITDLDAYSDLAPCAQDALSYAVLTLTEDLCPIGQSAFESCACTKNQNSLAASERINSQVIYYCGSTATEDISSAQAIFGGYCGLGDGTSNFPAPGTISGDVTYYISDLPMFASLAPCAASGISYAFDDLTQTYCPSAPNAMASCACFKDQNSGSVSSAIVSSVQYACSSTASADVTSAISVFNLYCNAAAGKVVPSGVTNSVAIATGGSSTSGGSGGGGGGGYASPHATPSSPGASATAGGDASSSSSNSSSKTKSSTNVALIGGIAGGVGAVALIAIAAGVWFCRKKRRQPAPLPSVAGSSPNNQDSKVDVELHQYSKMSSPSLKPQPGVYEVPAGPGISEMPNQPAYAQSQGKYPSPSQYTAPSTYTAPSAVSSPSMHTVSPVYEAGGRPAVPEMPSNNNMGYYPPPHHQQPPPGYPNQVYEMAPGQQPQHVQQLPPHAITSYSAGPVYEMYSPDTR